MSSFIKALQISLIILLIAAIVVYNRDIFNLKYMAKFFGMNKVKTVNKPKVDTIDSPEKQYDSDELFNTEYHVTEDMNEALSDALKSVV